MPRHRPPAPSPALVTRSAVMAPRAGDPAPLDEVGLLWVLATERPTPVFDWERYEVVDEVLLVGGMLAPPAGQVPLLDTHSRYSVRDVLGHVRDFASAMEDGFAAVTGRVFFADDPASRSAADKILAGHITDGSVGYRQLKSIWVPDGEQITFGGRLYAGPVRLTYQWELREFSATPIGADILAKAKQGGTQ
ncbi:MAG: hypothetical protein ACOX5Z_00170 [Desulfobulbus sp.]|jgi:hypothetical protein